MAVTIPGLDQLATVYTRTAGGGYTTVALTGVQCRLAHLVRQSPVTGDQRRELAGLRLLMWDPDVTIPETAQIEVPGEYGPDGVTPARWNVVGGTLAVMRGPAGTPLYRRCDVKQAR